MTAGWITGCRSFRYCRNLICMRIFFWYPETSFDFLGYTFRPRLSKNRWGKTFVNFSPAMSVRAGKAIRQEVRSWGLQNRSDKSLYDLAHMFNAKIRGWIKYYGAFYKSALYRGLTLSGTKTHVKGFWS
ncbi:group II intron maturase-specific domain-containing protein [Escherichia coli]|uniref:group II intron maturase-specific domain-containing protein n=1 Tax=Escherichia coli TaxID=562 RepID=UPI003CEA0D6A